MKTLVGTGEAARVLKVSAETIRAWSDAGRLHAERSAAGRRLFFVAEIERLAKGQDRKFKS